MRRQETSVWTRGVARVLLVHKINCTRVLVGAFGYDDNKYSDEYRLFLGLPLVLDVL